MKPFKTKLRYSGIIVKGQPIESLDSESRRACLSALNKPRLVNVAMQMSETINRLWEIYDLKESDDQGKK